MEFQDLLVREYGPVTVMQARVALRAHLDGQEMSGESYLTDIWVNRGANWQVMAGVESLQHASHDACERDDEMTSGGARAPGRARCGEA